MPRKGKRQWKGKRRDEELPTARPAMIARMQQELIHVSLQEAVARTEVKRLQTENYSLKDQIRQTIDDRQEYLAMSVNRVTKMRDNMAELKIMEAEKIDEIDTNKKPILTALQSTIQTLEMNILEKETWIYVMKKKAADMEAIKEVDNVQRKQVKQLHAELTTLNKKHDTESRDLKKKLLDDRKHWSRVNKTALRSVKSDFDQNARPALKKELLRTKDNNKELYSNLEVIVEKNKRLDRRRIELEKKMANMEREEQYWMDMYCMRNNRPLEKMTPYTDVIAMGGSPSPSSKLKRRKRKVDSHVSFMDSEDNSTTARDHSD